MNRLSWGKSGFNVEYFGEFALIFIAEYGMIIFVCFIILLITSLLYSWLFIVGPRNTF